MAAQSKAQRSLMAIAEHNPSELYTKNRSVLKMSHQQLHDFAATKGLKKHYVSKSRPVKLKSMMRGSYGKTNSSGAQSDS